MSKATAGKATENDPEPLHRGKDNEPGGVQVLSRAVDILRVVSQEPEELSLGKIAARVGLPRSTVQRIVNSLLSEKMLVQGPNAAGYRIGPQIHQLAEADKPDVPRTLHPLLEQLSETCGETVDLAMCRENQMVFLDQVSGNQRLRTVSAIGESFPMTVTANGKAVLALKTREAVKRIFDYENKSAPNSLKDLETELDKVRHDGFGLDIDEHTPGISAIGIAFKFSGAYYALSIPAPSNRFSLNRDKFTDELLSARDAISNLLFDVEFTADR